MERRHWDNEKKVQIVLEGLKGRSVADLCNAYQISQSMYYKWRDQFLANASLAFEAGRASKREERLLAENRKLKGVIGELTVELKKSDW